MNDIVAGLITGKETVEFRAFTPTAPPAGCVTVEITLCGICGLAKQTTVVASNAFTHDDFRRSMALLADGRVRASPLHTRTVALADLEVALRELTGGGTQDVKVLVDPRARAVAS